MTKTPIDTHLVGKKDRTRVREMKREREKESVYEREGLRERDREQQMINKIEIDTHLSVSETSKLSLVDLDKDHYIPPLT